MKVVIDIPVKIYEHIKSVGGHKCFGFINDEDYFSSSNNFEVSLVEGDKSISDEEIKKKDIEVYVKW